MYPAVIHTQLYITM